MDFPNEYAAMAWACANQLGRRNLDNNQRAVLVKEMYENQRKTSGGWYGNQYTDVAGDKNYPQPKSKEKEPRTTAKMAEELHMPEGTVKSFIQLGRGIDNIMGWLLCGDYVRKNGTCAVLLFVLLFFLITVLIK